MVVLDSCVIADYYNNDENIAANRKNKLAQILRDHDCLMSSSCAIESLYLLKKYSTDKSYDIFVEHLSASAEFKVADETNIDIIEQAVSLRDMGFATTEATMTAAIAIVNDIPIVTTVLPPGCTDDYSIIEDKGCCQIWRI